MATFLKDKDVREALSLIESAKLPHPSGPLLSSFIIHALDPRLSARYILETCHSSHDQQACLFQMVSDWRYLVESISENGCTPTIPDAVTRAAIIKRDGDKCCITGKVGRFWDPLIVVPILPVPSRWMDDKPRISNMLGAFFSPSYRDWWLAYARAPVDMSPYCNHWLVRRSASKAFARGVIKLDRLVPSLIEVCYKRCASPNVPPLPHAETLEQYEVKRVDIGTVDSVDLNGSYPLLGDHSRSNIEKVDPRFIGTHARLSPSFQWLEIAKEISLNLEARPHESIYRASNSTKSLQPSQRAPFSFSGLMKNACLAVWLMAPDRLRLAAYKLLQKAGNRIYGSPYAYEPVQRLPFGLYLKYLGDPDGFRNEFNALKMVRRYTSVPVPMPLDLILIPNKSGASFETHDAYLLTSRIPGVPLSESQNMLSDRDGAEFVVQMQEYLAQIRAIPTSVSQDYSICNTLGEPCRDPRISRADPVGPFVDEMAFNQVLRNPNDPGRRGHKIVFTHADLNPRNLLADRIVRPDGTRGWALTGIVDWENSGYYPEYWDYTKAFFEGFRCSQRWLDFMHEVFKPFGDLSKEFEVEKRSWEEGDYI